MTISEFKEPPKGYKNIDLAKMRFRDLEESVKNCSTKVPVLTYSSTRWLENALYSREIIEDEYNEIMAKIKEQTRMFGDKCECIDKEIFATLRKINA